MIPIEQITAHPCEVFSSLTQTISLFPTKPQRELISSHLRLLQIIHFSSRHLPLPLPAPLGRRNFFSPRSRLQKNRRTYFFFPLLFCRKWCPKNIYLLTDPPLPRRFMFWGKLPTSPPLSFLAMPSLPAQDPIEVPFGFPSKNRHPPPPPFSPPRRGRSLCSSEKWFFPDLFFPAYMSFRPGMASLGTPFLSGNFSFSPLSSRRRRSGLFSTSTLFFC